MGKGLFKKLEELEFSAAAAISLAVLVGIARYLLEAAVAHYNEPRLQMASSILDASSFYVQMFALFLAGQKLFLKRASYAPIAIGTLCGLVPPIADYLLAVKNPSYFYFPPDFLFLANGITPGEVIAIWSGIALFAAYIAARRSSLVSAIPAAIFGWFAMQFSVSAHPVLSAFIQSRFIESDWLMLGFPVRALFILLLLAYLDEGFRKFLAYRASRLFLAASLCVFAATLFKAASVQSFFLLVGSMLAFALIFMFNTRGDEAEDKLNKRPTFSISPLAWASIAILLAFSSAFAYAFQLSLAAASIPLLVVFLGFLYSRPLKLKCVFPLAYVLEGMFFSLAFISFAFLSPQQPDAAPVAEFLACFAVFSIGGAIKDYKDVPGDRAARVPTAFTLIPENLTNQFWRVFRALLVFGPVIFVVLETENITIIQQSFCALFVILASWLLFFAKNADREALVNQYIWLFSAMLLAVSIA